MLLCSNSKSEYFSICHARNYPHAFDDQFNSQIVRLHRSWVGFTTSSVSSH